MCIQGWIQICQQRNHSMENPQYPQSCFYGRNVYSDTYFFGGKNEYAQQLGTHESSILIFHRTNVCFGH